MANDTVRLSSASAPSEVKSDKSGHPAAQLLSETATAASSKLLDTTAVAPLPEGNSRVVTEMGRQDATGGSKLSQELAEQAQKLLELSQLKGWAVNFSVDNDLNKTVIRVVDSETQKTIRQIPSEELLTISKRIQDLREGDDGRQALAGLLFDRHI